MIHSRVYSGDCDTIAPSDEVIGDENEPPYQSYKEYAYRARTIKYCRSNVSRRDCRKEWTCYENCHPSSQNLTIWTSL